MSVTKPVLSISMLASNRLDTLPRCLDSLKPIMEAIPCELILVDTSKNPEVHALLLQYTDKVLEFEWCNDFAKARNVGLKEATGEWFMFIDDDEWFMDAEPLIEFFRSGEYKDYGFAHYHVRNYMDSEFITYSDGWVTRLTKIRENTAFHSKIHEFLAPYEGKDKSLDARIGHSGYAFKTIEDREKHFNRNFSLLCKMEEEEPDNMRWKVQIIQEYRSVDEWEELEKYCKRTLEYLQSKSSKVEVIELLQIHIGYAIALLNIKKYEEVKQVYRRCEHLLESAFVCKGYMHAIVAEACFYLKEYDEMNIHIDAYNKGYKIFHKNSKKYDLEALRIILAETFTEKKYCGVNSMRLAAELDLENYKAVYEIYPDLKWDDVNAKVYFDLDKKILDALIQLNDFKMLKKVLQDTLSSNTMRPNMMAAILAWKAKDIHAYNQILDVVKGLDIDAWYKPYAALLTLSENAKQEDVKHHAIELLLTIPNIFGIPDEILEVLKEHKIEEGALYQALDFMTWKDRMMHSLEYMSMEEVGKLKTKLENSCLSKDVRFGYFMIVYTEQKLIKGVEEKLGLDDYNELLYTFAKYTTLTYEALFADQLQQMEIEQLPNNYQAAMWLKIYFEEVDTDFSAALACLKNVVAAYPTFAKVIKYYISMLTNDLMSSTPSS